MSGSSRSDDIQFLVDRKYPLLTMAKRARRERPAMVLTPELKQQEEEASSYEDALSKIGRAELTELVEVERAKIAASATASEQARPHNQPEAAADFTHWSHQAYWSLGEAVALALGKEPELVNAEAMSPLKRVSPFAKRFLRLLGTAERSAATGQLSSPVRPFAFLEWARRLNIEVSPTLIEALAKVKPSADWQERHEESLARDNQDLRGSAEDLNESRARIDALQAELGNLRAKVKEPGTRERETMLKLIIGLAVGGYGYDPKAARGGAVPELVQDLERLGISVSDDTVRKYLRQGAELLPPKEEHS